MSKGHDLAVVGAGPAGLAAALAARRAGLAVVVVERRRPPLDKACGEGLMPAAVAALARLGVALPRRSMPFSGIGYRLGELHAEADFPGGACGLGARRTELSAALLAAAEAAGVELRFGVAATGLAPAGLTTSHGELAARFVVGADGLRSRVRRGAGLERAAGRRAVPKRFGVVRHFARVPWSRRVEVWFGDGCEAYVTPLAPDEIGVALLWSGAGAGFDALLARRLPAELAARLAGAPRRGRDLGAGPFAQAVSGVVAGGRIALAGDAAGYVDALTGEGIAQALGHAEALGQALAFGGLDGYARQLRRRARGPALVTHLALAAARRPALARRLVAALAHDPRWFARLLGVLGAGAPLGGLATPRALRFAGALLAPAAAPR